MTGLYAGWVLQRPNGEIDNSLAAYILTMVAASLGLTLFCAQGGRGLWQAARSTWEELQRLIYLLCFGAGFTGLFWLLLVLAGALFKIIGLRFLQDFLQEPAVYYPLTAVSLCYALGMAARYQARLNTAQEDLLRVLGLLHWPVSLIFLASLAFTGMEPLWKTGHASAILVCWALALALMALANLALHGGTLQPSGRFPVLALGLISTPLFVALACWSLGLRLAQYGISEDRLWAGYLLGFLLLLSLAYALAALHGLRRADWRGQARANAAGLGLALLIITLAWLPPPHPQTLATEVQSPGPGPEPRRPPGISAAGQCTGLEPRAQCAMAAGWPPEPQGTTFQQRPRDSGDPARPAAPAGAGLAGAGSRQYAMDGDTHPIAPLLKTLNLW